MADFIKRQAEGKLHLFKPAMEEDWFRVPRAAPNWAATPKGPMLQLDNWFRNQPQRDKAAACHQAIEIFQKRNPDLIKAELTKAGYDALTRRQGGRRGRLDRRDGDSARRLKRTKSDRMRMRTRVVQGLWQSTDEEREAVGAEVLEEKRKLHEEELQREKSSAELKSTSPWELQEGIDAVDAVFSDIHKAVFKAAGWVGMSISGGPNPRMGGDLTMKVVCFGQTPAGHDFEDCCVDFNENVSKAFQEFLKIVYCGVGGRVSVVGLVRVGVSDEAVVLVMGNTVALSARHEQTPRVAPGGGGTLERDIEREFGSHEVSFKDCCLGCVG
ncbi:hypothetical protein B0H10DRAFT_2347174 [Mycena sp. CBHHK59/15]|nr:hypothetical protein B0H10DRAFT_2347174 [Mycena sp. CBHHK59/15]